MIYNDPMLRKKKAQKVILTLEGTGNTGACYIEIVGTKYDSPGTIEVDVGTVVHCCNSNTDTTGIYLNGELVGSKLDLILADYNYTAVKNANIVFDTERKGRYTITITET